MQNGMQENFRDGRTIPELEGDMLDMDVPGE